MSPRTRRVVTVATFVAALVVLAADVLIVYAESQLDRRQIDSIEERSSPSAGEPVDTSPMFVLVVGSDSREGLTEEEQIRFTTGSEGGNTTDTILLFRIPRDGGEIAVVSFPRDLRVRIPDLGTMKINAVRSAGGPEALVSVVEELAGFDIDHYVEVTIPAFVQVVETVGPIQVCLGEPLRDPKSGADLEAGCQELGPVEALAYVRSRAGRRGDFKRIERQQQFLAAMVDELTATRTLLDPTRITTVVDRVAGSVTTDDGFSLASMVRLGMGLRDSIQDLDTATLPGYPAELEGISYVIRYVPGVEAVFDQLREGRLGARMAAEADLDGVVGLWTQGHATHAAIVESVLFFAGLEIDVLGAGPERSRGTVVYWTDGHEDQAAAVAAVLGAPFRSVDSLAMEIDLPEDVAVVVAVGETPAVQPVELG